MVKGRREERTSLTGDGGESYREIERRATGRQRGELPGDRGESYRETERRRRRRRRRRERQ